MCVFVVIIYKRRYKIDLLSKRMTWLRFTIIYMDGWYEWMHLCCADPTLLPQSLLTLSRRKGCRRIPSRRSWWRTDRSLCHWWYSRSAATSSLWHCNTHRCTCCPVSASRHRASSVPRRSLCNTTVALSPSSPGNSPRRSNAIVSGQSPTHWWRSSYCRTGGYWHASPVALWTPPSPGTHIPRCHRLGWSRRGWIWLWSRWAAGISLPSGHQRIPLYWLSLRWMTWSWARTRILRRDSCPAVHWQSFVRWWSIGRFRKVLGNQSGRKGRVLIVLSMIICIWSTHQDHGICNIESIFYSFPAAVNAATVSHPVVVCLLGSLHSTVYTDWLAWQLNYVVDCNESWRRKCHH